MSTLAENQYVLSKAYKVWCEFGKLGPNHSPDKERAKTNLSQDFTKLTPITFNKKLKVSTNHYDSHLCQRLNMV